MDEVEVDISNTGSKAIIEGKTTVSFKTFVSLVLQRKVQNLFKSSQEEPVIISSELLTKLASAPQDRQEDRAKLVLVTFLVGIVAGVLVGAVTLLTLSLFAIFPTQEHLLIVSGVIVFLGILVIALQKSQKRSPLLDKLHETMEKTTDLVTR